MLYWLVVTIYAPVSDGEVYFHKDAQTCNFADLLHIYRKCQVPLWNDWGTMDAPYYASNAVLTTHYHIQTTPYRIQTWCKAAPYLQPCTFEILQGKWHERLLGEIFEIIHKKRNSCHIPVKVSDTPA